MLLAGNFLAPARHLAEKPRLAGPEPENTLAGMMEDGKVRE